MTARLGADLGEVLQGRPVLVHVSEARAAEITQGQGKIDIDQLAAGGVEVLEGVDAVGEDGSDRAWPHLLETERQGAVDRAALDRLARQEQGAGPRRAVVVDVDDRDARHAGLVDGALTRTALAENIADVGLLDLVVGDPAILEGQAGRRATHDVVVFALARLGERDHPDPRDQHFALRSRHLRLSVDVAVRSVPAWTRSVTVAHRIRRLARPPHQSRPGARVQMHCAAASCSPGMKRRAGI